MTDEEVDELLKGVQIGPSVPFPDGRCPDVLHTFANHPLFLMCRDGNVNYESFVRTILSQ